MNADAPVSAAKAGDIVRPSMSSCCNQVSVDAAAGSSGSSTSPTYASLYKPREVRFVKSETESVSGAVKTFCSLRHARRCSVVMLSDSPPTPHNHDASRATSEGSVARKRA